METHVFRNSQIDFRNSQVVSDIVTLISDICPPILICLTESTPVITMTDLGGFVNMSHDKVRDLLAAEMQTVLVDAEIEAQLPPPRLLAKNCSPAMLVRKTMPDQICDQGALDEATECVFQHLGFYPQHQGTSTKAYSASTVFLNRQKERNSPERIRFSSSQEPTGLVLSEACREHRLSLSLPFLFF